LRDIDIHLLQPDAARDGAFGRLRIASELEFPEPQQFNDRLRATFHTQLLHGVGNMVSNCLFTNKQLLCNLFCCFVLNEQFENLSFSFGQ